MTDLLALADRIDPRKDLKYQQDAAGSDRRYWIDQSDLIAASDALRLLATPSDYAGMVEELQRAAEGCLEASNVESLPPGYRSIFKAQAQRSTEAATAITTLTQQAALARQVAMNECRKMLEAQIEIFRNEKPEPTGNEIADQVLDAVMAGIERYNDNLLEVLAGATDTLNIESLVERGAEALYSETPLEEGGETIDGFEASPTCTVTWAQIIEHDGYDEIAADFRRMSRAVLSAIGIRG